MHNLKSVKIHTLKAHLDRLQNTADFLAELAGGEAMAGRLGSSAECARHCVAILNLCQSINLQASTVRGQEPADN